VKAKPTKLLPIEKVQGDNDLEGVLMDKTLEELMFGAENEALVAKAVQDAVARADAAGLMPAFEPYTSLELRRQARVEKAGRDQEDLEFHRKVVDLLYANGNVNQDIKRQALKAIQLWQDRQTCIPRYSFTWKEWLDMPPEFAKRAILDETDLGLSMRCNSPFGFLKTPGGKFSI
jgi:hypothetical protein